MAESSLDEQLHFYKLPTYGVLESSDFFKICFSPCPLPHRLGALISHGPNSRVRMPWGLVWGYLISATHVNNFFYAVRVGASCLTKSRWRSPRCTCLRIWAVGFVKSTSPFNPDCKNSNFKKIKNKKSLKDFAVHVAQPWHDWDGIVISNNNTLPD